MKLEFYEQIFEKYSNIKFHENLSSGSLVVPHGKTNGRLDGRKDRTGQDKVNSRFSKFCESAKNNLDLIIIFYIYLERKIILLWCLPMSWRVNFCRKDYIYNRPQRMKVVSIIQVPAYSNFGELEKN